MSSIMELSLDAERYSEPVLFVSGRIDAAAAQILREECAAHRSAGHQRLIVSLADVSFVSSSGLGSFLVISEEFKATGGNVVFAAPVRSVSHVLKLLNLDQFLDIAPDLPAALGLVPA
jgi:anti-anti-sigma factor